MSEPLTDRFEFIEERLQTLEKVGLSLSEAPKVASQADANTAPDACATTSSRDRSSNSGTDGSEALGGCDRAASIVTAPERGSASLAFRPGAMSRPTTATGHEGVFSRAARIAQKDGRQSAVAQECQKELMTLVGEAVSSADNRLRRLVEQAVLRFTDDIEKTLQKTAGVTASCAIQLLQQEIQILIQRSLGTDLASVKTTLCGSTTVSDHPQRGSEFAPSGGFRGNFEQADPKLSVVVDTVRRDAAVHLSGLDVRLRETLRAFEEDAAKELAASFQRTVRELLECELEAIRRHDERPDGNAALKTALPEQSPGTATGQSGVHPSVGCHAPTMATLVESKSDKDDSSIPNRLLLKKRQETKDLRKKQPTWRILGLS